MTKKRLIQVHECVDIALKEYNLDTDSKKDIDILK